MFGYHGDRYTTIGTKLARRKKVRIYDDLNNLVCIVRDRMVRAGRQITVFGDEGEEAPLLHLMAQNGRDPDPSYTVLDSSGDRRIGSIRRSGKEWLIMDSSQKEIARLRKKRTVDIIRDTELGSLPRGYVIEMDRSARIVAEIGGGGPFSGRHHADFSTDDAHLLDRRLGISALLVHIVNGKEKSRAARQAVNGFTYYNRRKTDHV